jgi:hypothetical protein
MDEIDARSMIKPKSISVQYEGHHYTCTFDPHAPPDRRWYWQVHFTQVYDIHGGAPSLQQAQNSARRNIREMKKRVG